MPTYEAPRPISGRHAFASDMYEYVEISIAVLTSSAGASRNGAPRQVCGAKPIECSTPSRPLTCSRTRSARESRCSWLVTSSSITGAASGSRFAMRSTSDMRPKPVSTTFAPSCCAILAAWKASEASVMTPVISRRLPSSSPGTSPPGLGSVNGGKESVAEAEAAVDRQHRAVDVAGFVGGQVAHRRGDLRRLGVPAGGHLVEDLLLALLGQLVGHVGAHEPGRDDVRGDVAGAELARQRAREADQAGLRRRVVRLAGRAGEPDHRGDEDEPAPLAAQHAAGGPLRDPEGAGEVRVDDALELLVAHPHQQRVVGQPGVGHQHLDRTLVLL